jgi:hypothetical protein
MHEENEMSKSRWYIPMAVLAVLALAALACGGGSGRTNDGGTPAPRVLFEDNFSNQRSGWSTGSDQTASVSYRGGSYVFEIYETNWHIWGNPDRDFSNTRIEVTVSNVGRATDPTFGVICNYQDSDAFYYLGFGPDGYYGIVLWDLEDDFFLTSGENLWLFSDDIEPYADSYELEVECGRDGSLRLIVDGIEIASAFDDTYTSGDIGLFALSFDEVPVEVHFDNLVVTELR